MPIRSNYIKSPIQKKDLSTQKALMGVLEIQKLIEDLKDVKDAHETQIDEMKLQIAQFQNDVVKFVSDFHTKTNEGQNKLIENTQKVLNHVLTLKKGEDAKPVDENKIIEAIASKFTPPEDGKDAEIDYKFVVDEVLKQIPAPKEITDEEKTEKDKSTIEDIVEKIKKNKLLKPEHLDGWEQTISPIRRMIAMGSIRGGGDTVTAGSNITITTNSAGKKVITSTGGSGFTVLAATETIVSPFTNLVFTFATATAQPTFVVADGVHMKAVSNKGTTNWTWNNGAKQATLTSPPQDDIFAIA